METEAAILDALRSKDRKERERAEFAVFQQYHSRVRAILSRVVGPGAGLDDAVQEAFIDVFRGLSRFEGRSGLGTWIYRVALRRGWKCAARQKAAREREVGSEAIRTEVADTVDTEEEIRDELRYLIEALKAR